MAPHTVGASHRDEEPLPQRRAYLLGCGCGCCILTWGNLVAIRGHGLVEIETQCSSSQHLVRLVADVCLVTAREGELIPF